MVASFAIVMFGPQFSGSKFAPPSAITLPYDHFTYICTGFMLVITAMVVMGLGFAGGFWTQAETPSGDCHSHMPGAHPESQLLYV
jgi:hypothetical protein